MTVKKFELIAWGKKQPNGWDGCHFVNYIGTFLSMLFKNPIINQKISNF